MRKRPKKWPDLCEAKAWEPSRISLTLSRYCITHEFGISWKPSDYSELKGSSESQTEINNGNYS